MKTSLRWQVRHVVAATLFLTMSGALGCGQGGGGCMSPDDPQQPPPQKKSNTQAP